MLPLCTVKSNPRLVNLSSTYSLPLQKLHLSKFELYPDQCSAAHPLLAKFHYHFIRSCILPDPKPSIGQIHLLFCPGFRNPCAIGQLLWKIEWTRYALAIGITSNLIVDLLTWLDMSAKKLCISDIQCKSPELLYRPQSEWPLSSYKPNNLAKNAFDTGQRCPNGQFRRILQ